MNIDVNLKVEGLIEALHLEPGDVIVVTIDREMDVTQHFIERVKEAIEEAIPGYKVAVLHGMKMGSEASSDTAMCAKYGHNWERMVLSGQKPWCRRCGLEVHS